jgi:hypothetical protein
MMALFLGSMTFAVVTFAVDFRQLPKVVFLLDFRQIPDWNFGNSQKSSFVKIVNTLKAPL